MSFIDKQKQKLKEFEENYVKLNIPRNSEYFDACLKALTVEDEFAVIGDIIICDDKSQYLSTRVDSVWDQDYSNARIYLKNDDYYVYIGATNTLYGPFSSIYFSKNPNAHFKQIEGSDLTRKCIDLSSIYFERGLDKTSECVIFDMTGTPYVIGDIVAFENLFINPQRQYVNREISAYDLPKECFEAEHIVPFLQHYQTKFYEKDVKACSTAYLPELIEAYQDMNDYIKMEAFDGEKIRLARIETDRQSNNRKRTTTIKNKELVDNALEQAQKLF